MRAVSRRESPRSIRVDSTRVSIDIPYLQVADIRLPPDVDPCGEKGEFHTCVTAGPMFDGRLDVEVGEIVEREGFVYADLVPTRREDPGKERER